MMRNFELEKELINNHNDKVVIEALVENYKTSFAKELVNGGTGMEMMENIKFGSQPVRIKKPIRMRVSETIRSFKNKLKVVFGIE